MMASETHSFRIPGRACSLDEIHPSDEKVCVLASIVSLNKPALEALVSDSKAEAKIIFKDESQMSSIKENGFFRIVGKPFHSGEGWQINCEIIQSMDGLDVVLYSKVISLERSMA